MRIGRHGVIICNKDITNSGRIRFTIAHELGHWILHPSQSQDFLLTESNAARHKQSPMEAEANAFAGSLLMPRQWFGKYVVNATPVIGNIIPAADAFSVSVMAATRRFVDLTLIPTVAVFSDGEVVRWVWNSQGTGRIWLNPGDEISENTTAYLCSETPETATRIGAIQNSGEEWFPRDFQAERITVWEQSCRLYKDTVLTLMRYDVRS